MRVLNRPLHPFQELQFLATQLGFIFSKSRIETPEKGVKYVQS